MSVEELASGIEKKEGMQAQNDVEINKLSRDLSELEEQVELEQEALELHDNRRLSGHGSIGINSHAYLFENQGAEMYADILEEKVLSRFLEEGEGKDSVVGGGSNNKAMGEGSVISGGFNNIAVGNSSAVAGGRGNLANATSAVIGGGADNKIRGLGSTISGGTRNIARLIFSSVGGGEKNKADASQCTIGGGQKNRCRTKATASSIVGGKGNVGKAEFSTVTGGKDNEVKGEFAVAMGGRKNRAKGSHSVAVGNKAKAKHNLSFAASLRRRGKAKTNSKSNFMVKTKTLNLCIEGECVSITKNNAKVFKDFVNGIVPQSEQNGRRASVLDLDDEVSEVEREVMELRDRHEMLTDVLQAQFEEIEELRSDIEAEQVKLMDLL